MKSSHDCSWAAAVVTRPAPLMRLRSLKSFWALARRLLICSSSSMTDGWMTATVLGAAETCSVCSFRRRGVEHRLRPSTAPASRSSVLARVLHHRGEVFERHVSPCRPCPNGACTAGARTPGRRGSSSGESCLPPALALSTTTIASCSYRAVPEVSSFNRFCATADFSWLACTCCLRLTSSRVVSVRVSRMFFARAMGASAFNTPFSVA